MPKCMHIRMEWHFLKCHLCVISIYKKALVNLVVWLLPETEWNVFGDLTKVSILFDKYNGDTFYLVPMKLSFPFEENVNYEVQLPFLKFVMFIINMEMIITNYSGYFFVAKSMWHEILFIFFSIKFARTLLSSNRRPNNSL